MIFIFLISCWAYHHHEINFPHSPTRKRAFLCMTSSWRQDWNKKKNFQLITRRNSYKRCSIGTMRWNNCTLIFHFPPIVFTFSCVLIRSARSSHLCHVPMLFTHMEAHSLHVWNKSSFILWLIYQKKLRCKLNPGQLILLTPHRLEHNNAHLHAKP